MHHFGFLHDIPRDPTVSTPLTVVHRDINVMFDDFSNHLVLEEAHSVPAPQPFSVAHDYIQ